jgi:diadenosine tetraphosphate (Ap4A) HIT family hydrolase
MPGACPFCQPQEVLWSGERVLAVRDRYPVSPGHALVITRRHVASYFEATAQEKAELWEGVEWVRRWLEASLGPAGYNVGFNCGAAAGQTIDHLHIHVIPRYPGDVPDPRGGLRHVIPGRGYYPGAGA